VKCPREAWKGSCSQRIEEMRRRRRRSVSLRDAQATLRFDPSQWSSSSENRRHTVP
jgi:hypothetical protein